MSNRSAPATVAAAATVAPLSSLAAIGGISTIGGSIGGIPPLGAGSLNGAEPMAAGAAPPLAKLPATGPLGHPFTPLTPVDAQPVNAIGASASASTTTKPTPAAPDPIAEAPAAIWYVRPVSGGQFGPAAGDVMRQWLAQRRVGADSMVWREGWADWMPAAAVFPLLFPSTGASDGAASTSDFADDGDWVEALIDTKPVVGSHGLVHSPRSKGKQNNTIVIVSFFLILLCLLLAVVMVTVYIRQNKEANDSPSSMRPRSAARAEVRLAQHSSQPLVWLAATS